MVSDIAEATKSTKRCCHVVQPTLHPVELQVTDCIESFRASQAAFWCNEKIFARFVGLAVRSCFTHSV